MSRPNSICPQCGRSVATSFNGTLVLHWTKAPKLTPEKGRHRASFEARGEVCRGSRKKPGEATP